ncbi:MAG: S8 family serine peptidase [Magnetococcales bacterium]|nr:S8 family serine peptidase [Magnetococcales bacterium]
MFKETKQLLLLSLSAFLAVGVIGCGGGGGGGDSSVNDVDISLSTDKGKVITDSNGLTYPVDQLLVSFEPSLNNSDVALIINKVGAEKIGMISFGDTKINQLKLTSSTENELAEKISSLRSVPGVLSVSRDYRFKSNRGLGTVVVEENVTEDFSKISYYSKIGLPSAIKSISEYVKNGNSLSGLAISVVDSGLDINHKEFSTPLIYSGPMFQDTEYHGTFVTSIIASANNGYGLQGILTAISGQDFNQPKFSIGSYYYGDSFIESVANLVKAAKDGPKVINNSYHSNFVKSLADRVAEERKVEIAKFGSNEYSYIDDLLTALLSRDTIMQEFNDQKYWYGKIFDKFPDVLFVFSAGNYHLNAKHQVPANIIKDNLIVVGASQGTEQTQAAEFSNYGDTVTTVAPGKDIFGADLNNSYKTGNGTSFSTPIVTGIIGLMLSVDSTLKPSEIKNIIVNTGTSMSAGNLYGKTRINADRAIDAVIARIKTKSKSSSLTWRIYDQCVDGSPVYFSFHNQDNSLQWGSGQGWHTSSEGSGFSATPVDVPLACTAGENVCISAVGSAWDSCMQCDGGTYVYALSCAATGTQQLSDVTVNQPNVTIKFWDHGSEDGDRIAIWVDNDLIESDLTLTKSGQSYSLPISKGTSRTITIKALNVGTSSPNTATVSISNVVSGSSDQKWSLKTGETAALQVSY